MNEEFTKYWEKRFEYLEKMQLENDVKFIEELSEQYDKALMSVNKEINNWLVRFSVNNQISLKEARKQLNEKELKELKWDVEEYIKYGQENGIDLIWAKQLENASAKVHITRLEAIKLQIQEEIEKLFGKQEKDTEEYIMETYRDGYYTAAYELQKGSNIAFKVAALDTKLVAKVISRAWTNDNQTFSDRIWKNKKALIDTLQTDLTRSIILGKDPDELIQKIAEDFKTSKNKAGRLVMTESAFFSSSAKKDCFNDLGVKEYILVATLDSKTSEICQDLDGKVFKMSEFEVGKTAPPFHCWCRTTYAPYFKDEYEFGERAARDTNGNTYYIPRNITYKEWKEKYIDSDPQKKKEYEISRKMSKNRTSDFEQYNRYKTTLGNDEVGKTFAEFQKMKYNDIDKWNNLKATYLDKIGIVNEEQANKYIENINKTIDISKQSKHIRDSEKYIPSKSYLTISTEEAQNLVNKYAGTGEKRFDKNDKWMKQEIVYSDKIVGVAKNSKLGDHETKGFKIHYSKDGTHIVPFWKEGMN